MRQRVDVAGFRLPPGLARGFIGLVLVGTLIALQFTAPASGQTILSRTLQTLVFAVVAFYFGSRRARRPVVTRQVRAADGSGTAVGQSTPVPPTTAP